MFRHPFFCSRIGQANKFGEEFTIDQWIRHYKHPGAKSKMDALNLFAHRIKNAVVTKKTNSSRTLIGLASTIAVAASIIIAVILFYEYDKKSFYAGNHAQAFFPPDGSRIILEKNSNAQYAKTLLCRKIELAGNGYFEISKGKPLQVATRLGSIKVLGTRFYIYEANEVLFAACYEGKIVYDSKGVSKLVEAGSVFSNTAPGKGYELPTNLKYPEIAYFQHHYSSTPLQFVLNDLEKHFGIKISTIGLKHPMNFSGNLYHPQIDTLLSVLCIPFGLSFKSLNTKNIIIKPIGQIDHHDPLH